MINNMLKIRAHHLLCIPRFYSGGYNKVFGKNLKRICFKIRKNPNIKIKIIKKCDDICNKCPHKKDNICKKTPKLNYWILAQDNKVLKKLKLKENSVHNAKDVFNLSIDKVNSENIRSICKGCVFLENCMHIGINNSFKKDLNKRSD
ncbi:MAG: DUF1284 domain-containing protein [Candidatus Aenigmarchaeota archaeon]|nr:DUF1284 domain-containing protein [Candidatus Aenigmarchaeota archaeon]